MPAGLNVLFVCQHGAAKSVIAARHFTELAQARGLSVNAAAAGIEPYDAIPAPVVAGLQRDGLDDPGRAPHAVTREQFENADIVVSFGCDLSSLVEESTRIIQWYDVPAVSDGYDAARAAILGRLPAIVDEAERRSKQERER